MSSGEELAQKLARAEANLAKAQKDTDVARLHRKVWRDALGALQYGGSDMGKGCKVYWPREKVRAFLEA